MKSQPQPGSAVSGATKNRHVGRLSCLPVAGSIPPQPSRCKPALGWAFGSVLGLALSLGPVQAQEARTNWPQYVLTPELVLPLQPPGRVRFDASALLLYEGGLVTVRDQEPTPYRIQIGPGATAATLVPLTNWFAPDRLRRLVPGQHLELDCEGLAQDNQGRLYLCDEVHRWILRCDPRTGQVERLAIDWAPVKRYFGADRNASFEGIAIGDGRLYVANERTAPVIIAVDLASLKVVDHFVVIPHKASLWGTHYSDLSWWGHRLYVLCRQHQVVLQVKPHTHTVEAEFDYAAAENRLGYGTFGLLGLMEGLAVDEHYFWLVTDNNGLARQGTEGDSRPVLLKCPRPDRRSDGAGVRSVRPGPAADGGSGPKH
jgi:hypothetical protein